ncbi:type II toxin-antitoxin system RelE/ParE family toxin [Fibrobacter sp. UWEL]|uniref:type II toxin-antitoxin system RelE/ParE family toxin n=1 Tax=Fibrobacter sp. UWEL TaxID=1896209 RepID=UPI0009236AAB|nr:type II toxin-antitoxin system RelE/ParE family toxin [Fibrobacter sp. UWEL]SHL14052.1 putative addiction module killer protein [Fibrobacter sp. UWEL]
MYQVKRTEQFIKWMKNLRDVYAKSRINNRLKHVELGNLGDSKSVGDGVFEMRIDYGPGYRLYYMNVNGEVIFLLIGGDKSTQQRDIEKAKEIKKELNNG